MGLFDFFKNKKIEQDSDVMKSEPKSVVYQDRDIVYGTDYPIITKKWDGEKTLGELGVVVRNVPDYQKLRLRSYNAYATIDTVKTIASKYFYWSIGSGLKLQAEPNRNVLKSEGISNSAEFYTEFQKTVESRFMIHANSIQVDFLKEKNLHELAMDFYKASFLGGDCLCIVRFDDYGPNIQFVSGEHICDPGIDTDYLTKAEAKGNYIQHGIEIDKKGSHVAYFVRIKEKDSFDKFERIPAYGSSTKKRLAWLVSGEKISPDHLRAVPGISSSLEKINKLDRYVEASVNKAENGAKMVYTFEHDDFSTGEDPLQDAVAKARRQPIVTNNSEEDRVLTDGYANRITQTTNGLALNLPRGVKVQAFESKMESNFNEFHNAVFNGISAGQNVPPEVAMQSFNSNYSASRAAINSFGYFMSVDRAKFANQFYVLYYKLWLEFQILSKKIVAPGYLENMDNFMVIESYSQCRFMGKNMPHIDPLKEIKAIREMLGLDGAIPLISKEQATEMLGAGQWDENFMKGQEEDKLIPKEVLMPTEPTPKKTN